MKINNGDACPPVAPPTCTQTYAQTAAGSSSVVTDQVGDHNSGAFVGSDGPGAAVHGSAQTTLVDSAAVPILLLPTTIEQLLALVGTKCEESLCGIKESFVQFMWGGMEQISKLQQERNESLEAIKQLQSDVARERDANNHLQRENNRLEAAKQTVAIQLDKIRSQHNACGGIIGGLRRNLAASIDQQSQQLQAASTQVVADLVLPKVADETIRERWTQLVLAIRKFAKQHLAWDYNAARDHGDSSNASGRDGADARGCDSRETMRGGLDLIHSETSALAGGNPNEQNRALGRLRRLVLEAQVWRLLGVFVFENKVGLWGGPAGELFSELCDMLSPSSSVSTEAVQRLVNWRVHGAAMIDQSIGIDAHNVSVVVSNMTCRHLRQFVVVDNNRNHERCVQQLATIVHSAVELYVIFTKSRAIFEVCWPNTGPPERALLEATSGRSSKYDGRIGDGSDEEDDQTQEVLYTCRGEPRFLAVSPALTKRGTADGDRYEEQIMLVQARVIV
jgi:FtsZ-binding cell division protein ZapB